QEHHAIAARRVEGEYRREAVRVPEMAHRAESAAFHQPVAPRRAAHVEEVLVTEAPGVEARARHAVVVIAVGAVEAPLGGEHRLDRPCGEHAPSLELAA